MGKFDKYSGKIKLIVDEEEWVVTPTNRQIAKFLTIDKDDITSEKGFINVSDSLTDMFVAAYPTESKADIASFVLKKMDIILTQLVIAMGWSTQEQLDKAEQEEKGKKSQEAEKKA